jgi:hypothetical protein
MASGWVREMREHVFGRYRTVVIVAYCLGGLLTTMGLRQLFSEDGAVSWQKSELALFLLDAPHELPEAGPSDWLAGLLDTLDLAPEALRANAVFCRDCFRLPSIQAYAVISEQESWVTACGQTLTARRPGVHSEPTHTELARASAGGTFPPYDFVLSRIRELL